MFTFIKKCAFFIGVFLAFSIFFTRYSYADWTTDTVAPVSHLQVNCYTSGGAYLNGTYDIQNSTGNITCSGAYVYVIFECTDQGSGCASANFTVSPAGSPIGPGGSVSTTGQSMVPMDADGVSHTITFTTYDNAGNGPGTSTITVNFSTNYISGAAYIDYNNNCSVDAGIGDTANSGFQLTLSGTGSDTAISNSSGYNFPNLASGSYTVAVNVPLGYTLSNGTGCSGNTASKSYTLPPSRSGVNFFITPYYQINGYIYTDNNDTSAIDTGDGIFLGHTVTLSNGSTTNTDSQGHFVFSNLPAGTYTVSTATPLNYKDVLFTPQTVTIVNQSISNINFLVRGYKISGTVYVDYDHDCVFNGDDSLGSTFTIQASSGNVNYPTTGVYTVTNLTAGTYTITDAYIPSGYTLSSGSGCSGNTASRSVTVNNGTGNITGVNFYLTPLYTVSGAVYLDVDGSDTINTGDTRVQNVSVTLSNGQPAVSDANGNYTISNVISGSYSITAATPLNYKDVLTILPTGVTSPFPVPPSRTNINFLVRGYKISGTVYVDYDHDCVFNGDDSLGSTFTIQADGGVVNYPTTGVYTVSNLTAGTYTITDTYIPSNYTLSSGSGCSSNTASRSVTVNNGTGNITGINFYLTPLYTVSGNIHADVNDDGIINDRTFAPIYGEANVTVTLSNGQSVITGITDSSGTYRITNVLNGSYTATAPTPNGYKTMLFSPQTVTVNQNLTNIHFLVQGYKVTGTVYVDYNHDCAVNNIGGNDVPYANRTLTLSNGQTRTSGAAGEYSFLYQTANSLNTVELSVPNDYSRSICSPDTNTNPRAAPLPPDQTGIRFYLTPLYTTSGTVYLDVDGSDTINTGDSRVQNVTVTLSNGQPAVSDANGNYTISNVISGSYSISAATPPYYKDILTIFPTGVSSTFPVPPSRTNINFLVRGYKISGTVYNDKNHDCVFNGSDVLYSGGNLTLNLGGLTYQTGAAGTYSFVARPADSTYTVTLADIPGYTLSTGSGCAANTKTRATPLPPDQPGINYYLTALYTITGTVFIDTGNPRNGIKDAGESGYTATPSITATRGLETFTPTFTGNGGYRFDNLTSGTYTVILTVPNNYEATNGTCSPTNCTVKTSLTVILPASPGPDAININFGITNYTITGNVNLDYNHNCVFDSDEYGTDAATNAYSISANGGSISYPATGTYRITNLVSNTYTVTISPSGYVLYTQSPCALNTASRSIVVPPDRTPTFTASPPSDPTNFFITPRFNITGRVWIDYHNNSTIDADDIGKSAAAITLSGAGSDTATTDTNGDYAFNNLYTGQYTITLTVPDGYIMSMSSPNNKTTTLNVNRTINFYITPLYSISGNIFVDTNKSNCKDGSYAGCTNGSESNYSDGQSSLMMTHLVTGEQRPVTTNTGAYTGYSSGTALVSGQWKVEYTSLPTNLGYKMTFPTGIGNPSFTVVVGKPGTSSLGGSPYSCNPNNTAPPYYYETSSCFDDPTVAADNQGTGGGSIHDLNFGISNSFPWLRCTGGGNCRFDSGIDDPVPAAADLACGGSYASITDTISNSPSIFFSGNNSYSFCAAGVCPERISTKQWVVGNNSSASFAPVNSGVIRTSYNYLLTTAKQSGITPVDIATYCTLSNCILPANLPNGVYHANGDLVIDTNPSGGIYTFPANKNFVILVNGNLTVKASIKVPIGSTATFSSAKSITIDAGLGVSSPYTSNTATIEGFYSADESFSTGGINNCVIGPDKRLNLAGSFVVGANGSAGGKFLYTRDLCAANLRCPAIAIYGRPDFLLNAPDFIKHPNFIWQEAAP